jgi:hypothetical protein
MMRRADRRASRVGRRSVLALGIAFGPMPFTFGCAAARPAPPPAPVLATPSDALPPDLDLVVRLDLARIRAALGAEGLSLVRRGATTALAGDAIRELMQAALERSDTALLALRPELIPGETDNVLVLEGHFSELGVERALRAGGFGPPIDLGGDVRRFDHPGKLSRSAAARVYAFGDERLVFASTAEIDSVEAVVERGMAPSSLKPKASGVLGLAARLRGVTAGLAQRYPLLAVAFGDAIHLEGSVESTDTGLSLEVSLELPDEAGAIRSADAFGRVRQALLTTEGKLGAVAESSQATAVGRFVVVRVALARGML